jgi:hypothetical protein
MEEAEMTDQLRLMREDENNSEQYQDHIEKIMNFQAITQTSDTDLAAKYLIKNEWDESKAAKEYYDKVNKQDFESARHRAFNQMYANENMNHEPEAEALIEGPQFYYQEFHQNNQNHRSIFSVMYDYSLRPIGKVLSYLIPGFVKRST